MRKLHGVLLAALAVLAFAGNVFAVCPAGPPALLNPGNNGSVPFGPVLLDWSDVPNATGYDVYLGLDGDPPSLIGSTNASQKAINVEPGRSVQWKAVATAPACNPVASGYFVFATTCPANPPNLQNPGRGTRFAVGEPITFNWSPVAGAASYDVKVTPDFGQTWTVIAENHPSLSFTTDDLQQGDWGWYVRANFDGDCDPLFSQPSQFYVTNCTGAAPVLVSPANNASLAQPVTFQWTDVGAESYGLFVQRAGGIPRLIETTRVNSVVVDDLSAGTYEWWAAALSDDCPDLASNKRTITITSSCNTTAPNTISPASNAANVANPVTFKWSSVAGAERYRLLASIDGGPITAVTTTTSTETTETLEGSAIVWAVQALFPDNCPPTTSGESRFTLQATGCPSNPAKPTLVSPAANATSLSSPVTFTWSAVPNAVSYRLTIIMDDDVLVTPVTTTSATVPLRAGNGFWAVQALFGENCPPTLSDRRAFTVSQGASCSNAKPQLLSPANNAANVGSPALFQWSDVPDAIGYTLFISTATSGEDFVPYGRVDGNTNALQKFVAGDVVRWFIVAHFSGCADVRSDVFRFGTTQPCPPIATLPLVGPADGAEVTSPVTLSWTAGGSEYRVSIETEAGAAIVSQRTTSTSATFRLPVGVFYWRVDVLGNCPLSSARRSFTVREGANCAANTAPALVSPVGTEAQPAQAQSPVTLRWNGVPNAIAYRLFIAREGQPFEESTLLSGTEKALELEPGRYRWFVNGIFEGCPAIPSAVAHFVIARPGCVTASPAILAPDSEQVVQSPVTFLWSEVEGATKYRVIAIVEGKPFVLGTTAETSLTRILPPGQYVFTVETELDECPSTRAPLTRFTVAAAQNCSTAAPELLSPPNGSTTTGQEVDFTWTPVSGALRYAVIARLGEGAETTLGTTEDAHLVRNVPAGVIHWRVVAFFRGCDPVRSQERAFTVQRAQDCDNRKPALVFPRNDDEVPAPVAFEIVRAPKAIEHRIWVARGEEPPSIVSTTPGEKIDLPPGSYSWFAEARFANCAPTFSSRGFFIIVEALPFCDTPRQTEALVIGQAVSGTQYRVRWKPLPNVTRYEVQESTSADFANARTFIVDGLSRAFRHEAAGAPVQYLYRVRGLSDCNDAAGPFSDVVGVYIIEPRTTNGSTELGEEGAVVQTIFLPGGTAPRQFTARTDKPWLTVTPAAGTVPVEGLTLTVTADPSVLGAGTNTGTVQVEYSSAAGGVSTHDASSSSTFPMSVSLVTPVMPSGKGTPPPDALIFAGVGHAAGINGSFFESDIRVTNLTAQTQAYDLNFTPSGVNGTEIGSSTTVEIAPNETLAIDDIVATLFGGTTVNSLGVLEVRPVTSVPEDTGLFGSVAASGIRALNTAASSRTYNFTPNGTFGQFVPATRFADFVGRDTILSLQQVSESVKFRANFGFLEASGNAAELEVRVYDTANTLLSTIPVSLQPMQHRQLNGMLRSVGLDNLTDGRVEVEVVGGDGKVSAYVSEVDNATNDPLMVWPAVKGATVADRYVVPGMAYLDTGAAFWVSDLRIFNAGTSPVTGTMIWVPQGSPSSTATRPIRIEAGQIAVFNNVVGDFLGQPTGSGGAIIISTPEETTLTVTARTYNQTAAGTYGQYIVGVTPAESIGKDDRALQILQLEQSTRMRTNVAVTETTGKGATVELSLITPDSLVTQVVTIGLAPNEFRQIGLVDFQPTSSVYNARVTVKVIDGEGRVTASAAAIDQITQDPTYVPAQ